MPNQAITAYATLRKKVKETLLLGQERIEREKVRTYWETGRIISDYLGAERKPGQERQERHQRVVERLARDLEIHPKILYRCVQFAVKFPYFATWRNKAHGLTWSHYRTLLAIPDEERRVALAHRAARLDWGARELQDAVKKISGAYRIARKSQKNGHKAPEFLKPKKGTPYTYRLVRSEKIHPGKTDLRVDLGFSSYLEASMKGAENFKAGDIALSEWVKGDVYRLVKADFQRRTAPSLSADARVVAQPAQLFTYYAYVERVVDGDTLLAQVDLGFGVWTRQYLRLRGIDSPEIDSSDGRRAKQFVESELSGAPYVVITSSRSDKYDRYLADVFYTVKGEERFLQNRLLESLLAQRTYF